ncbi:MAG TPA: hypothetical protein VG889_02910 [Rhizomicrobium sp.]|nr:hypothetical protein [Rhizomicrobium sp.]
MILGLSLPAFTLVHVLITLVAILSGLWVMRGMLRSDAMRGTTLVFVVFSALTNLTGFLFPIHGQTPALTLGLISSVVMLVLIVARYMFGMRGFWRPVYVVTAMLTLWFNVFVLIVQSFQKIAALQPLAPFATVVQGLVLVLFVVAGWQAWKRFRP